METDKWKSFHGFLQLSSNPAGNLEKEITHVLEVNFNKMAPFGNKTPQRNSGPHREDSGRFGWRS